LIWHINQINLANQFAELIWSLLVVFVCCLLICCRKEKKDTAKWKEKEKDTAKWQIDSANRFDNDATAQINSANQFGKSIRPNQFGKSCGMFVRSATSFGQINLPNRFGSESIWFQIDLAESISRIDRIAESIWQID